MGSVFKEIKNSNLKRFWQSSAFLILIFTLISTGITPAQAANYTITYDANPGYVGAVAQAGVTSGSVPVTQTSVNGAAVTVSAQGSLARQGFDFAGWNTAQNGTGTSYAAGSSTGAVASSFTLYAKWTVPVAARLIGNGGNMISVVNTNNVTNGNYCLTAGVRGITSDGTNIFFRPSTYPGYICTVSPTGVIIAVNQVTGILANGLADVGSDQIALVYGNGCLFLRKDLNTTFNSLYCISLSNWTLSSVPLPSSYPMPSGGGWLNGNFIQFPDGRIGSVSAPIAAASWSGGQGTGAGQCPTGMYCKNLRLYTVSGTGSSVTTSYSTDFVLVDTEAFPSDDHGIATDGTYLYQIRHIRGYKVWALQSSGPSYLVFNADGTGSCGASTGVTGTFCQITYPKDATGAPSFGNGTYLGRSHGLGKYLIGDYDANSKFWLSDPATPPPGPGNPDVTAPTFLSSASFSIAENTSTGTNVATINVSESSTITISGGVDSSAFSITRADTATAYIRFVSSPDYEAPTDVGSNNVYNITLQATDTAGNSSTQSIAITVTNVNESGTLNAPSIAATVYKGVVTTITISSNVAGTVRFFVGGKRISNCLSRISSGTYPNNSATCAWKPPVTGRQTLTATLTPNDGTFSTATSAPTSVWVLKRLTSR